MLKETPVVGMSSASMLDLQEPLGIDALLPKPFYPKELIYLATRLAARPRRSLS